jgi:hypothetical protein
MTKLLGPLHSESARGRLGCLHFQSPPAGTRVGQNPCRNAARAGSSLNARSSFASAISIWTTLDQAQIDTWKDPLLPTPHPFQNFIAANQRLLSAALQAVPSFPGLQPYDPILLIGGSWAGQFDLGIVMEWTPPSDSEAVMMLYTAQSTLFRSRISSAKYALRAVGWYTDWGIYGLLPFYTIHQYVRLDAVSPTDGQLKQRWEGQSHGDIFSDLVEVPIS